MQKIPETAAQNEKLRSMIEKKIGVQIHTPKDFILCRNAIFEELHVNVSISTLKRYWGYVSTGNNYLPNRYTLNIFTKFAGYKDWDDFSARSLSPQHRDPSIEEIRDALDRLDRCISIFQEEIRSLRALFLNEE